MTTTLTSTQSVVDTLRCVPHLLSSEQIHSVETELQQKYPDVRVLLKALIKRRWLTTFQAQHVLRNQIAELTLGNFLLFTRLGEGGMGEVYKAKDLETGQFVALKTIRADRANNKTALLRFQREARLMKQLDHPNVVTFHRVEQIDSTFTLVMEYVQGKDLARILKEKAPLPVNDVCECMRQAALALQYAHEQGLVHRDVKPHNLLLTPGHQVKLLDLGIARAFDTEDSSTAITTLTQDGVVVGTADYLAPEQARNAHTADHRADVYSLGCTFYQLLAGLPPFEGESMIDKLMKHQNEDPIPVEEHRPEVARPISALIRRMMAKEPGDRPQTAKEIADFLAAGTKVDETVDAVISVDAVDEDWGEDPILVDEEETQITPPDDSRKSSTKRSGSKRRRLKEDPKPVKRPWNWKSVGALIGGSIFLLFLLAAIAGKKNPEPKATPAPDNANADKEQEKTDPKPEPGKPAHRPFANSSLLFLPEETRSAAVIDLQKLSQQEEQWKKLNELMPGLLGGFQQLLLLKALGVSQITVAEVGEKKHELVISQGTFKPRDLLRFHRPAGLRKSRRIFFNRAEGKYALILGPDAMAECKSLEVLEEIQANIRPGKERSASARQFKRELDQHPADACLLFVMDGKVLKQGLPAGPQKELGALKNLETASVSLCLTDRIDVQLNLVPLAPIFSKPIESWGEKFIKAVQGSPGVVAIVHKEAIPLIPLLQAGSISTTQGSVVLKSSVKLADYTKDVQTLKEKPFKLPRGPRGRPRILP